MAYVEKRSRSAGIASAGYLAEISDPKSGVVALPNRSRPKLRRHASRLRAKDLALMPSVSRDVRAIRTVQSKPSALLTSLRRSPFVTYLSTVVAALAVGTTVGIAAINGWVPDAGAVAKILHFAG